MRFQCSVLKVQIVIFRNGPVAQLVRAPPCHGGGREFESLLGRLYGIIAQLGEHLPYKQRVIGSSPIGPIYNEYGEMAQLARASGSYPGG